MSTLAVVEEVLREAAVPMTVKEIVARAGARLPSKSKTPDTVVARDLSMDLKKKGEASRFARPAPGQYTLRALLAAPVVTPAVAASTTTPVVATALRHDRVGARAATPAGRPGLRLVGSR
jgi:hypothetical protein